MSGLLTRLVQSTRLDFAQVRILHKHANKERSQYLSLSSHCDRTSLVNKLKDLLYDIII